MKAILSSTSLAIALLCTQALAQTQLYEWVDENGVTHFSQQPPPDSPNMQPTNINGAPVISGGEPQLFVRTEQQPSTTPQTGSVETEISKKDPEKCAKARESIRTLTESARVRLLDEETGEYNVIDDTQRQRQLELWREEQSVYC